MSATDGAKGDVRTLLRDTVVMPAGQQMQATAQQTDEQPAGLAARLIAQLLFRKAHVSANVRVAPGMHLITLQGPELQAVRWTVGDKLQVRLGAALQTRTYTPLSWDVDTGATQILAHALALGPGSEWVYRAAVGQPVSLFGPRRSLDLSRFDPSASVLLGDETAIGLVAAWRPGHALIETRDRPAIQALLDSMGLAGTAMAAQANALHLDALANAALGLAGPDTRFVLVGRARTVQHLLKALRQAGVRANRLLTKAYWADGKAGLD
jgi:ferric-chelate reductase (NADPH)